MKIKPGLYGDHVNMSNIRLQDYALSNNRRKSPNLALGPSSPTEHPFLQLHKVDPSLFYVPDHRCCDLSCPRMQKVSLSEELENAAGADHWPGTVSAELKKDVVFEKRSQRVETITRGRIANPLIFTPAKMKALLWTPSNFGICILELPDAIVCW